MKDKTNKEEEDNKEKAFLISDYEVKEEPR